MMNLVKFQIIKSNFQTIYIDVNTNYFHLAIADRDLFGP
jgi:hypothetical protein